MITTSPKHRQVSCKNNLHNTFQSLLEQTQKQHQAIGVQLSVDSPPLAIHWQGACGFTDADHNPQRQTLTPQHPLRIASNTKTYIAAAILRLWEQQKLDLDSAIEQYLCPQHSRFLQTNGYALAQINTRQLLAHTSGLYDYADSPAFVEAVFSDPQRQWTRTAQLELAMGVGKPYGEPGEVYRYSDTGYILLGEIIERVSQQSLAKALRQLLNYQSLGLNATWLETAEPDCPGLPDRIHQYEKIDDAAAIDTYPIHGSFDIYGGGGLLSTVGDMTRFMRGLFEGAIFSQPQTLNTMLAKVPAKRGGPDYGFRQQVPGVYRLGIEGGNNDKVYSHKGHFGTLAAYLPEQRLAIALCINTPQAKTQSDRREAMLAEVLTVLGLN